MITVVDKMNKIYCEFAERVLRAGSIKGIIALKNHLEIELDSSIVFNYFGLCVLSLGCARIHKTISNTESKSEQMKKKKKKK